MPFLARGFVRPFAFVVLLGLPALGFLLGDDRLVPFLAMPVVILGLPMLARTGSDGGSEPDAEDADDSGDDGPGGGRRPNRGPGGPTGPSGALPLPHSTPASWRTRGHGPERVADPGRRRAPHRAPQRAPQRPRVR